MTTNSHVFTGMDCSSAVMGVTLHCDAGYSTPLALSPYFDLSRRCKMQKDERDLLEILIFDEIEDTVGTWLRAIIQRLEKEQTANVFGSTDSTAMRYRSGAARSRLQSALCSNNFFQYSVE
jgi:hypothetical protein